MLPTNRRRPGTTAGTLKRNSGMEYLLIGLAIAGFALALSAFVRVERLERILKEKDIIDEE